MTERTEEPRSGNCPECGRWRRTLHRERTRYICACCLEDRAKLRHVATIDGAGGAVEVLRDPATGAYGVAGPDQSAAGMFFPAEVPLGEVMAAAVRAAVPEGGL